MILRFREYILLMSISNLNANWKAAVSYRCINSSGIGNVQASGNPTESFPFQTGTASVLGANELYANIVSVPPSASESINLQELVDVLGQTVSLVRVKGIFIELMTEAEGGSDASSITIGGGSEPQPFFMTSGANTWSLNNGSMLMWADNSANGVPVNIGTFNVQIFNNDADNEAYVSVTIIGADS
jgi:hypothetical protein